MRIMAGDAIGLSHIIALVGGGKGGILIMTIKAQTRDILCQQLVAFRCMRGMACPAIIIGNRLMNMGSFQPCVDIVVTLQAEFRVLLF